MWQLYGLAALYLRRLAFLYNHNLWKPTIMIATISLTLVWEAFGPLSTTTLWYSNPCLVLSCQDQSLREKETINAWHMEIAPLYDQCTQEPDRTSINMEGVASHALRDDLSSNISFLSQSSDKTLLLRCYVERRTTSQSFPDIIDTSDIGKICSNRFSFPGLHIHKWE